MELKPGYQMTEVGVIPDDWDVFTIGETVTLINGRAFKPSDWTTYGLPIIRIQNLNDPLAVYNYYDGVVEDRYYVKKGDILFAWSGTKESSFGARMWRGETAILNQHIFRVVPDKEKLLSEYVLLALKRFQEDIERKSHGFKSSFVHIRKSDLEKTYLAIPPLPEQRSIATVLSNMDALLVGLDRLIAKKRDLKQAAMQQILTGKKRLPGFGEGKGYQQTEVGLIPEDWRTSKVGEVCGFIVPGRNKPKLFDGDIPWITTPDLEDGQAVSSSKLSLCISRKEAKSVGSKIVPPGSVLMSCAGELGIVALAQNEIVVNQQLHVFIPTEQIDGIFLLNALAYQKDQIASYGTKTAVPYLNKTSCNSISIPLPPFPEQRSIATILSDMDAEIAALEQRHNKTRALKQGMMQELLTGRTRLVRQLII